MSLPAQIDLPSLTAGDAEWFDQVAAGKRAAAGNFSCPAGAAQLEAEAAGIEAMVDGTRRLGAGRHAAGPPSGLSLS